jgi:hypothetical protein
LAEQSEHRLERREGESREALSRGRRARSGPAEIMSLRKLIIYFGFHFRRLRASFSLVSQTSQRVAKRHRFALTAIAHTPQCAPTARPLRPASGDKRDGFDIGKMGGLQ